MSTDEAQMAEELQHMGPVDYAVFAWPGGQPPGDGSLVQMIIDLSDRGIIRVLDLAIIAKDADGTVGALDLAELGADHPFSEFEGASSGLMDQGDLDDAAADLEPDTAAAVLVWENRWAAPLAEAIRRSGGLLIDGGRIPVQGILAALDAIEAAEAS